MSQMPPDEQLRHLLSNHDRLLTETANQNRELHEWAVRFGPRPAQLLPLGSYAPPGPSPTITLPAAVPVTLTPGSQPRPSGPMTQLPPMGTPTRQQPPHPSKPALSTTQIVARLVAGAGALVTLVGVAFILVLAAQSGYFGPAPRALSAAGLGIALGAGAFVLHRRDPDNAGGPALLATGMAAGFLALVAGTSLYDLMPGALGLVLAGLLGIGVCLVAAVWRSEWLACLAIAAALVIGPWVSGDVHLGAAFMVVLSGVAAIAHLRVRWPVFHLARTLPTTVLLISLASVYGLATSDAWLLVALSGVHAVLGVLSTLIGRRASDPEQWALSVPLIGPAIPVLLLAGSQLPRLQGAWVAVAAAALYLLVALAPGAKDWAKATGVALAGVFAVMTIALATDLSVGQILLPAVAVTYMAAAAAMRSRGVGLVALAGSVVGIVSWLVDGLPAAFGIHYQDLLVGSVLIALLAVVSHVAAEWILREGNPGWLRYALIAVGLLGSAAAVTSAGYVLGAGSGSATGIHQASSVTVTVGWALASVVVLRAPLRSSDHSSGWIKLGLSLAAAATGKLFLLDLALLPGLARGVAFLLVGLLLLALGISYAKAYERARDETPASPAPHGQGPA